MSGLNTILNTATSTLLGQQSAIAIASKNLANVNTDGYQRRTADFAANGSSGGISVREVRSQADIYIGAKTLGQESRYGAADASSTLMASLDQMFAIGEDSIGARLDDMFNAIRSLETDPSNLDLRREVISTAQSFTSKLSGTALSIEAEQRRADQSVDGVVENVNALTGQIAQLNKQIIELGNQPEAAGDLMDKRERLTQELAGLISISKIEAPDGQYTILFNGGHPLVDAAYSSTLSATPDAAYGDMRRIDMTSPSGVTRDITGEIEGGQLGGVLSARDDELPALIDRLDQLAFDAANALNGAHAAGFGLDGVSGRNFFEPPTGVAGAARNLELAAGLADNPQWIAASTTAATAVGGNDNLAIMLSLEDANLSGGGVRTLREDIADITAQVGRAVRANQEELLDARQELDTLSAMRESDVGVSIDEEMLDIVRFQRAYQAGAKLVQTANQMFDTVINM